jgi:hypothetical protein
MNRVGRNALLAALLFGLGWLVLSLARDRTHEHELGSDEPEWIAISILHWRQLAHGEPPAGADLKAAVPGTSPWKQGVQNTTFGYMNPCLPKILWGASFAVAGHMEASPYAFQSFYKDAPRRARAAHSALLPAMPLARQVIVLLATLSGVLMFFIARAVVPGRAGWVAAGGAWLLWLLSPLVLSTASSIRTDHFMLPFVLGTLLLVLARREELVGALGHGATLRAALWVGLLGGLAASSKLNGALALIGFAVAAAALRPSLSALLTSLAAAAVVALCVFAALNPILWSGPVDGVLDILARWDKLMTYFQTEWAPRTGAEVAHTLPERVSLFARKLLARDEPLGALTGLPLGLVPILGGAAALGLQASGKGPFQDASDDARSAARTALIFAAVLVAGTALWLPLDWARLFLPAIPAVALLEACCLAALARPLLGGSTE